MSPYKWLLIIPKSQYVSSSVIVNRQSFCSGKTNDRVFCDLHQIQDASINGVDCCLEYVSNTSIKTAIVRTYGWAWSSIEVYGIK